MGLYNLQINNIHPDATDLREANKVLQKLKVPTVAWEKVKEREWI